MFVARPSACGLSERLLQSRSSAAAPYLWNGQPDSPHCKRDGARVGHRVRMEHGLWCRPDLDVAGARAHIHPDHLVDGGGSDHCEADLLAQARRVHAARFRLHRADARHDRHRARAGRPQMGHGFLQGYGGYLWTNPNPDLCKAFTAFETATQLASAGELKYYVKSVSFAAVSHVAACFGAGLLVLLTLLGTPGFATVPDCNSQPIGTPPQP
eukprot:scaffold14265_cov58-Phaeocystis_antarctica.AAC.3